MRISNAGCKQSFLIHNYWQGNHEVVEECQGEELWLKPFAKGLREREGRALESRRKTKMHSNL